MDTLYAQHAGHPVLARYMYLILFEPPLSFPRQLALMCLVDPPIVVEYLQHLQEILASGTQSRPAKRLLELVPNQEEKLVNLFVQGIQLLMAFQREASARSPDWKDPLGKRRLLETQLHTIMEVALLYKAVSRGSHAKDQARSIREICAPSATPGDSVAAGMHPLLKSDHSLRYALAGHTHKVRIDQFKTRNASQQMYMNTGSWLSRLALPRPKDVTPQVVDWLRKPTREYVPLRDVPPRCIFALIQSTKCGPSHASLCIWEGGSNGQYRVLSPDEL